MMTKTSILTQYKQAVRTFREKNAVYYVNNEIFSQYNDDKLLHLLAFLLRISNQASIITKLMKNSY